MGAKQSNIHVRRGQDISAINSEEGQYFEICIQGVEMVDAFREMVRRSLNCWPDAHPALKELGDMLEHGRILQDYYSTRTDKKTKKV
jgi:hypothetical protein